MYSDAERAALAALLARARANEIISEEEAEAILPASLLAEFVALTIKQENDLIDQYDDAVAANYWNDPETIKYYKDQLHLGKKAFKAAPKKLDKLIGESFRENMFNRQLGILIYQRDIVWKIYNELSDTDRLWTKPDSEERGWPPELVDEPPMKVVLPDAELPTAYALRRLLARELGVEP